MRRRTTLAVAVLLVTTLLTACTASEEPAAPRPTSTLFSPGPVGGPIVWRACPGQAHTANPDLDTKKYLIECGALTVPQDWKTAKGGKPADGRTFTIAMMRIHLKSQTDKIGTVLANPGGPGASGIDFAAQFAGEVNPLLERFDLIGFDPRGVGNSSPIECFSDEDLDKAFGVDPDPVSDAGYQAFVALNQRMATACGTKYGETLPLYSTVQAANDIEAIRVALGEGKLNYLGFSYGTLLGAVYAQLFPTNIRAMVLDGAVDPTQRSQDSSEGQAKGFELALRNFVTWCKANSSTCEISDDPMGAINQAMQRARTDPLTAADGRSVTPGWVWYSVLYPLYSQTLWPYLGTSIANLNAENPRVALLLADLYADRDTRGNYKNTMNANAAVNCADSDYPTVEEIRTAQEQWRPHYPFFGGPAATGMVTCAVWPGKKDPYPTGAAKGAPPIVVIGTVNDPATPYQSTAKLADMLGVGTVVTWEGEGHTAYPNTLCIRRAVDNYFIDLTVPPAGLTCPAE